MVIVECISLGNQVTSALFRFVLRIVIDGAGRDVRGEPLHFTNGETEAQEEVTIGSQSHS